jgi:HEAT repeat protein
MVRKLPVQGKAQAVLRSVPILPPHANGVDFLIAPKAICLLPSLVGEYLHFGGITMRLSRFQCVGVALAALAFAAFALTLSSRGDDKQPDKTDPKAPPGGTIQQVPPAEPVIYEIEGKNIDKWIYDTKSEDPSVRERAIRAIVHFGPRATIAVPCLVERCTDPEASPRLRAVMALTVVDIRDSDRSKVIDALAKRLEKQTEDPQGIVRYHAAVALNRFGEEAKSAIPGLINAVGDRSSFETRKAAIAALRQIARDAKNGPDARATHALLDRLAPGAEPAADVRLEAILSLGYMGRPADKGVLTKIEGTLKGCAQGQNKPIAIWAIVSQMALGEINKEHLDKIAKFMTTTEVDTRIHAARALGSVGPKARPYVGLLMEMLNDKDYDIYAAGCVSIMSMGEPGEDAIKALTKIAEAADETDPRCSAERKAVAKAALEGIKNYEKNKEKTVEKKDDRNGK